MRTKVEPKKLLQSELLEILENLDCIVSSHESGHKTAFLIDERSRTSSSLFLSLLAYQPKNRLENIFKQIMHENILHAEKISANSSSVMIRLMLKYIKKRIALSQAGVKDEEIENIIKKDIKIQEDKINKLMKRPRFEDLEGFIESNFKKSIAETIITGLKCAGPAGSISFEHSNTPNMIVEAKSFYEFDIVPDENILIQKKYKWHHHNVRTLCIEGFIESVSEIDRILSCASDKKVPLLIVCLGYSAEVVSTVLLNNDRGTFNVMLACPLQEQHAMNDLGDMSAVFGSPYHGYQTGAISSSFKEEDFDVSCQEIIVTSEKVKIRNSSSKKIVKKRQDSLIEKLGKSEILDDYLQRRIFSLSSNQVKIIVPEKSSQQKFSEIEELDRALRCSRSIMKFGIIKIPTSDDFFDSGTYIASSIYTGLILGYKFSKQLFNIDKCIVIDD